MRKGGLEKMALEQPTLIQQLMVFVEDFTPIKPLRGISNDQLKNFTEGMHESNLWGIPQDVVFACAGLGLTYAFLVSLKGG